MNDYAAQFANAPAARVLPEASEFWKHHKIEAHVFVKTPLWEYLTAPQTQSEKARCQMMTKLENGDLLVIFRKKHLQRAIAHIWGIEP